MLAVGDDDRHGSCDASEPSRARAGHLQGSPPSGSSQPIRYLGMLGHARSAVGKENGPWTRVGHPLHLPKCSTWNILSGYCCTYNKIWTLTAYETTETGYSAASAKEDFPAAGFGGGGRRSADAIAGEAAILQGDQEADYVVSGCRRSGLVQKSWTGVPDEDQSGAMEGDDGREEDIIAVRIIGMRLEPLCEQTAHEEAVD